MAAKAFETEPKNCPKNQYLKTGLSGFRILTVFLESYYFPALVLIL
jgi:hypothetical protein